MIRALTILAATVLLAGCASRPRPTPLTQADIISMVKAQMPDEEIIRRIDATQTVFRLGSDDVILLRKEGVSDRLVNYMLDTYTRAAVAEQRRQDSYGYNYSFGYYYGYPWRCW